MTNTIPTAINDLYNSITGALNHSDLPASVSYWVLKDILNDLDKLRVAEYNEALSPEEETDTTPEEETPRA